MNKNNTGISVKKQVLIVSIRSFSTDINTEHKLCELFWSRWKRLHCFLQQYFYRLFC